MNRGEREGLKAIKTFSPFVLNGKFAMNLKNVFIKSLNLIKIQCPSFNVLTMQNMWKLE